MEGGCKVEESCGQEGGRKGGGEGGKGVYKRKGDGGLS